MPDLSSLLADKCWVDVEVPTGGAFKVAYRPGSMSLIRQAELLDRIEAIQSRKDMSKVEQAQSFAEITCDVVVDWDLTDNGEPLAVTPEAVARIIPGSWTMPIVNAVMNAGVLDKDEKKISNVTSGAGLPQVGKSESARNGTRSSEPVDTWA